MSEVGHACQTGREESCVPIGLVINRRWLMIGGVIVTIRSMNPTNAQKATASSCMTAYIGANRSLIPWT